MDFVPNETATLAVRIIVIVAMKKAPASLYKPEHIHTVWLSIEIWMESSQSVFFWKYSYPCPSCASSLLIVLELAFVPDYDMLSRYATIIMN